MKVQMLLLLFYFLQSVFHAGDYVTLINIKLRKSGIHERWFQSTYIETYTPDHETILGLGVEPPYTGAGLRGGHHKATAP